MTSLFAAGAFLLGSIPFALLLGRTQEVDIRTVGSRNVGATNLGRALGLRWFLLAFVLDAAKGFAPTLAYGLVAGISGKAALDLDPGIAAGWLAIVFASVAGHMFSPWVGFRGGKGVATGLGALLGVFPVLTVPGIGAFVVFLTVLGGWRYVGLASVLAAASLPVWVWFFFELAAKTLGRTGDMSDPFSDAAEPYPVQGTTFVAVTAVLAVAVIAKHRGNIARLIEGTEPKVGSPKTPAEGFPSDSRPADSAGSDDQDPEVGS